MAKAHRLPNSLFIGADKAGSTWLYEALRAHPACFIPAAKDIYFFDRYYDRGLSWYARFFEAAPATATVLGELSHDYLYSTIAAARIAKDLPGVRLIVFLRNPVERAFSEYLYLVRSGMTSVSFEEAIGVFPETLDHSRYAKHLTSYFSLFDRSQIGIFLFDGLQANPRSLALDVYEFLGLQPVEEGAFNTKVLPAARPRSRVAARLAKAAATAARERGLPNLVGRAKRSRLAKLLYVAYGPTERPQLAPKVREDLTREFEPDVRRLEAMTGLDLQHWAPRPKHDESLPAVRR